MISRGSFRDFSFPTFGVTNKYRFLKEAGTQNFKNFSSTEFNEDKKLTELETARLKKKHGAVGWHDWCVKNWGTKWDADDAKITSEEDFSVVYEFNTAWSPPAPLVFKIRSRFPKLKISAFYDEPGAEHAGYY